MGKGIQVRAAIGAATIVLVCAECGGKETLSTLPQFCDQYVRSGCNLLYTCNTGAALDAIKAQYGPDQGACVSYVEAQLGCATLTCPTGTFSPSNASACLDAMTCAVVNQNNAPQSCNEVCAGPSIEGGLLDSPSATPQGGLIATVQPIANDTTDSCNTPVDFETIGDPTTSVVVSGTGGATIACTIAPSGSGYQVTASASTGTSMFSISGLFMPRPRDGNGNPTQDSTFVIPNITATFQDSAKSLHQSNCTVQYLDVASGQPGVSLPVSADVFADSNGGRVWASVFCNDAINSTNNPQVTACDAAATFRFENCAP